MKRLVLNIILSQSCWAICRCYSLEEGRIPHSSFCAKIFGVRLCFTYLPTFTFLERRSKIVRGPIIDYRIVRGPIIVIVRGLIIHLGEDDSVHSLFSPRTRAANQATGGRRDIDRVILP